MIRAASQAKRLYSSKPITNHARSGLGFFGTLVVGTVGYQFMGGKELIKAKIENIEADTRLKNIEAEQLQTRPI